MFDIIIARYYHELDHHFEHLCRTTKDLEKTRVFADILDKS